MSDQKKVHKTVSQAYQRAKEKHVKQEAKKKVKRNKVNTENKKEYYRKKSKAYYHKNKDKINRKAKRRREEYKKNKKAGPQKLEDFYASVVGSLNEIDEGVKEQFALVNFGNHLPGSENKIRVLVAIRHIV